MNNKPSKMERIEITYLGMENGIERKRISFLNPNGVNTMKEAHKYFTKDQKKEAKLNHKKSIV